MTYLIEVPLDGADPIVMEIDDGGDSGIIRSARPGEVVATATKLVIYHYGKQMV
jgi:hypothetical protein